MTGGATAVTHRTLAVKDVRLPVKDVRLQYMPAGSGEPVVLLHGWPQTSATWGRYAYDPHAVRPERMRSCVDAMRAVGALRGGLGHYTSSFASAEQNARHVQERLTMPVLAMAGAACLGPLTKRWLELAATDVRGGVIERCGHWIGEERPDFIAVALFAFFAEDG